MKLLSIVEECIVEQLLKQNPTSSPILLNPNQIYNPNKYFKTNITTPSTISQKGVDFIKSFENFKETVYIDSAGKKTIGYGTRIDYHPDLINKRLKEVEASKIMEKDLIEKTIPTIKKWVKVPLTQNQVDALSSLIYNIGSKTFVNSNLLKMINSKNVEGIMKDWSEFRLSANSTSKGLIRRREEEIKTFLS